MALFRTLIALDCFGLGDQSCHGEYLGAGAKTNVSGFHLSIPVFATGHTLRWRSAQSRILEASLHVAERVAAHIFEQGLARVPRPDDHGALIRTRAHHPVYPE